MAGPAPMSRQELEILKRMALNKQRAAMGQPQVSENVPGPALTPASMGANDQQAAAAAQGILDPTQPVVGGVQPPQNILQQAAAQGAAQQALPPPPPTGTPTPAAVAPAPAPAVGGQLGPGVTMDPTVKISPPQTMAAPKAPAGSDMPDPHAPDPADEDPDGEDDGDEDDGWRIG